MSSAESSDDQILTPTDGDWLLRTLIFLANRLGVELGITLQLSGILISGQLVSGRKYMEGIVQDFRDVGDAGEGLATTLEGMKEDVYPVPDLDVEPSPHEATPTYIHLRDAHIFSNAGTSLPGNRSVWWRGRVSEVSGFFFGVLS